MPTRDVTLIDQQSQLTGELMRDGRCPNATEALREGLRLLGTVPLTPTGAFVSAT
ncbi:MAG: hypothetical protein AAFY56_15815 [Pseudomonadota bacterium]